MADSSPWLTVVTVVKDDVPGMAATLASLSDQDLDGVEYVVVDSSTNPSEIPDLLGPSMAAQYLWTEPRGIYAAMNDGLARATGRFAYFANAGDALAPGSLRRVRELVVPTDPLWAFGHVAFASPGASEPAFEPSWDYATERRHFLARRRFPPHQGIFMRTEELRRQGGFDTRYRITADYLSMLRAGQVAAPLDLGLPVARFTTGGASTHEWRTALREFHRARVETLELTWHEKWHERMHTVDTWARTAVYRGLLAR